MDYLEPERAHILPHAQAGCTPSNVLRKRERERSAGVFVARTGYRPTTVRSQHPLRGRKSRPLFVCSLDFYCSLRRRKLRNACHPSIPPTHARMTLHLVAHTHIHTIHAMHISLLQKPSDLIFAFSTFPLHTCGLSYYAYRNFLTSTRFRWDSPSSRERESVLLVFSDSIFSRSLTQFICLTVLKRCSAAARRK